MRHKGEYFVYIVSNYKRGILYIGVTNDLIRRIYEHKHKLVEGFTQKYYLNNLVYYEIYNNITNAINREKRLKKWYRKWKIELIEQANPNWDDLYETLNPV